MHVNRDHCLHDVDNLKFLQSLQADFCAALQQLLSPTTEVRCICSMD
jgi:hypothetical protein